MDNKTLEELDGKTDKSKEGGPYIPENKVRAALASSRSGKSPGQDNIPT